MKRILFILLFLSPLYCEAYVYWPNVSMSSNVNYSQVHVSLSGTASSNCITLDSARFVVVNNSELLLILNTGGLWCTGPVACGFITQPFFSSTAVCPPPNLNGTYSVRTVINDYACTLSASDTLTTIDTISIVSGPGSNSVVNISSCSDYIIHNDTISVSGTYNYNLPCDSNVTFNVSINHPTDTILNISACNSYIFNGFTLTLSGTYYDTIINASGCDSAMTLNLIINGPSSGSFYHTACNSYFFNNQTLTSSGTYYDTLVNANGCDSTVTLHLTINGPSSGAINQTACNSYFFNNQMLTSSGTYYDTLVNANGCDSILTLNLIINNINNTVVQSGTSLTSNENGATYQWLNCPSFSIIPNATNQNYIATSNGDYAVRVTKNNCVDTSSCIKIVSVGVESFNSLTGVIIAPNPTTGRINISFQEKLFNVELNITNSIGQKMITKKLNELKNNLDLSFLASGTYYIEINANDKTYRTKIVKTK